MVEAADEFAASMAPVVWSCAAFAWAGVGMAGMVRGRARARVGDVFVRRRAGVRARVAFAVFALLVALAASWSSGGALTAPVFAAGLGSALAFAASPSPRDEACGELGVRSGWNASGFGEIEEWRLAGEHLRWKLRGEWLACSVPSAQHGKLRTRLEAACPGRESAFKG